MKAEFSEAIAYLERWYTWRDTQTDVRYGNRINSGWLPNVLCPDELQTYIKHEHGKTSGKYTLVYCQDVYRYDLFQWEDAMRGNGTCLWETTERVCCCYGWPGAVHSLEWTEEDDVAWMAGHRYPQTESALRDQTTWQHLKDKYGYDAHYQDEHPNDVVLVIEEGDNATQEEVRSGTPAADAKRLVDSAEAMGEDAAYRELAEALQAFSASASRVVERVGFGLRQHFPLDESGNGT